MYIGKQSVDILQQSFQNLLAAVVAISFTVMPFLPSLISTHTAQAEENGPSSAVSGEIFSESDGASTDGATFNQGERITASTGVRNISNSDGISLLLVADGSTPGSSNDHMPAQDVFPQLLSQQSLSAIQSLGDTTTTTESGSFVPVDEKQIQIAEDAPVGDWSLTYYLVKDKDPAQPEFETYEKKTFNFTIEECDAQHDLGDGSGAVVNTDTSETFDSIQDAIDDCDTEDGHTIEVGGGTYSEDVSITKELTLQSKNGKSGTTIEGTVNIMDSNVQLGGKNGVGFEITKGNGIGIDIKKTDNDTEEQIQNITIRDNKIHDVGNITGGNPGDAVGIYVQGGDSIDINRNNIFGITADPSLAEAWNDAIPEGILIGNNADKRPSNITIRHNNISDITGVPAAYGINLSDPVDGITIKNNKSISDIVANEAESGTVTWVVGVGFNLQSSGVNIKGNTFKDFQSNGTAEGTYRPVAVDIKGGEGGNLPTIIFNNFLFKSNSSPSDSGAGVEHDNPQEGNIIDATKNFWGTKQGPDVDDGQATPGAEVDSTSEVTHSPWLCEKYTGQDNPQTSTDGTCQQDEEGEDDKPDFGKPGFGKYQCRMGPLHLRTEGDITELYAVNENGTTTPLQNYDQPMQGVLAVKSGGQMYSITTENEVIKLNANGTTNAPKQIKENGDPVDAKFVAMDFAPDGSLYAMTQNSDKLYEISKGSGAATHIKLGDVDEVDGKELKIQGGDLVVTPSSKLIYTKSDGTVYSIDLNASAPYPVENKERIGDQEKVEYPQSITSTFLGGATHYALDRRGSSHDDDTFYEYKVTQSGLTDVSQQPGGKFWYGDGSACPLSLPEKPQQCTSNASVSVDDGGDNGDVDYLTEFSVDGDTLENGDSLEMFISGDTAASAANTNAGEVRIERTNDGLKLYFKGGEGELNAFKGSLQLSNADLSGFSINEINGAPLEDGSGSTFDDQISVDSQMNTITFNLRVSTGDDGVIISGLKKDCKEDDDDEPEEPTPDRYQCSDGPLHLNIEEGDGESALYDVDLTDGSASVRQEYEESFTAGLAIDAGGDIYAVSEDNHLHELNADGTTDNKGSLGISGTIVAMEFGPDGTLYALEESTNTLYEIDTTNGDATALNAFDDLNVQGGDLVVTPDNSEIVYTKKDGTVYSISLAGGYTLSTEGTINDVSHITSMTWDNGTYVALDRNDDYYTFTLDPFAAQSQGAGGPFSFGDAARCAPEPEEPSEPQVCKPDVDLVENGEFEKPTVTHEKNWNIFDGDGSSPIAWMAKWLNPSNAPEGPAHVELHAGVNGWNARGGAQYAELDSDYEGPEDPQNNEQASTMLYQDVSTIPGKKYKINYSFSPRPNTSGNNNKLELIVGGKELFDQNHGPDQTQNNQTTWDDLTYSFTATSTQTRIAFFDRGTSDSTGTFLDSVSMYCQPGANEESEDEINLEAKKVVCDSEADLPNWGENGAKVDNMTAHNYAKDNSACEIVEGWQFQWAPGEVANEAGDGFLTGPKDAPWSEPFSSATTISLDELDGDTISVREVLKDGYIPFTYLAEDKQNTDNETAEFYCSDAGQNYDNNEWVSDLEDGENVYCVGFNAEEESQEDSGDGDTDEEDGSGTGDEDPDEGEADTPPEENPPQVTTNSRPGGQFLQRPDGGGDDEDSQDGQVAGAQTGFGGQCSEYLKDHLRQGWANDMLEVMKLQTFLDVFSTQDVPVTGEFDARTEQAVRAFQKQYSDDILTPWVDEGWMQSPEPTGFVYLLTRWKINSMVCDALREDRPSQLLPYQG